MSDRNQLQRVYDAAIKVRGQATTPYPDCRGLIVTVPDGVYLSEEGRVVLVASGKAVQYGERLYFPMA